MSTDAPTAASTAAHGTARRVGIVIGPLWFLVCMVLSAAADMDAADPWAVVGVVGWTATWWFTEAIPIPATSLLPAVLLPATGVLEPADTYARYADGVVLMFLGGFIIAAAIERRGLHRRAALYTLALAGRGPRSLLAGVMLVTAVLSAWISNTAAAMLMLPIVLAVVVHVESTEEPEHARSLGQALLLGIAYAATLGGLATLIGTPPNAILASVAGDLTGTDIGFARWMLFAMPMSLGLLFTTWLLLAFVVYRLPARFNAGDIARPEAREKLAALGAMRTGERRVLVVFLTVALAWATRPLFEPLLPFGIDDTTIALIGALACFAIPDGQRPGERLLGWEDTRALPWGVLVLLGGGLALAEAFTATGLDERVGTALSGMAGMDDWLILAAAVVVSISVTEIASNTASAAALIPIAAAVGAATGVDPLAMAIAVALGSSCGFMMPAGTPPIAIAFSTGRLPILTFLRVGFAVNLACAVVVTAGVATGVAIIWG